MNNNLKNNLNPWFITGFSDAEGCFHVSIVDKAGLKAGKSVRVLFQISLHKKDKALLDQIKNYFCVGSDQRDITEFISEEGCFTVNILGSAASTKSIILKENRARSGVYILMNLLNAKVYIGSAQNISKRFNQYFNLNYLERNTSMPICRALLKHGYENFSFSILEYCEVKDLMDWEGYYLNILWEKDIPRYNLSKNPVAPFSGRKHSPESLKAMSEAQTGENNPMFGLTGEKHHRFGKPRAEGAGNGLPPQKIEVFDKNTNLKTYYESIREASRALNIGHYIISKYFSKNQQKPYKGRYVFKKVE